MMGKRSWVVIYRIGFAALAFIAMGYQLYHLHDTKPEFAILNFFSFFTIESNIFAACVLVIAAWFVNGEREVPSWFDLLRGAAVVYMTTTGIVYGLLLSGYQEELQTTLPWVDTVVHRIMPIVLIVDWLFVPPHAPIDRRKAARWLIYPLVFVTYSLIRGPIVDWYPYPFLDPDAAGGYGAVALYCVGIAIGIIIVSAAAVALSRRDPRTVVAT